MAIKVNPEGLGHLRAEKVIYLKATWCKLRPSPLPTTRPSGMPNSARASAAAVQTV